MHSRKPCNPRCVQAFRGWSAVGLRCLLWVLVAWQAPIPWADYHGTLNQASGSARVWLASHLKTHHPATSPSDVIFFGWHMHADFPVVPGHDPEQTGGLASIRYWDWTATSSVTFAQSVLRGASLLGRELPAAMCGVDLSSAGSPPLSAQGRGTFWTSFCPPRALTLRLCTLRN